MALFNLKVDYLQSSLHTKLQPDFGYLDVGSVPLGRPFECQVGQRRLLTPSEVHLEDISRFGGDDPDDALSFSWDILRIKRDIISSQHALLYGGLLGAVINSGLYLNTERNTRFTLPGF